MQRFGWKTWGLVCSGALSLSGCADATTDGPRPVKTTGEDISGIPELAMPLTQLATACVFAPVGGVATATIELADDETAVVSRRAIDGAILVNGTPCGTATAANTKRVSVTGSSGANTLILDFINGTFATGYGSNPGVVVDLGGGTDALKIRGSSSADTVTFGDLGFSFNTDTVRDGTHANVEQFVISLGAGNDVFSASGGFGTGAPFATAVEVFGGDGNDTLTGGLGADMLHGGAGNDTLRGASDAANDTAADVLNGDDGDDLFDAGDASNGGDTFNGGAGRDHVSYAKRTNPVTVTMGTGANDGETGESDDVAADIEVVTGGSGDDVLTGGPGNDTINGGPGDDTIDGGLGDDVLNGDAGDDTFLSAAADGADVYNGGAGIDTLSYAGRTAGVTVSLDNQANDGETGEGDNAKSDIEDLVGGDGDDTLSGSAADNRLTGGDGNDTLYGLGGNDTFVEGDSPNGADTFHGGPGVDTVDYSGRTASLTVTMGDNDANDGESGETDNVRDDVENVIGGSNDDDITGNALANNIDGGAGADVLRGGPGNDVIYGGPGDDVLYGDDGDDLLDGGAGDDTFDCGAGQGDIVIPDSDDQGTPVGCEL